MSLKTKIILFFFASLAVFALIQCALYVAVYEPEIFELEDTLAHDSSQRPLKALEDEMNHLSSLIKPWADWDQTYRDMGSSSTTFKINHLKSEIYKRFQHIHLISLIDGSHRNRWSRINTPDTGDSLSWEDITGPHGLPFSKQFIQAFDKPLQTVLKTPYGPLMVVSRPIHAHDTKTPSPGIVIMGRFIDSAFIQTVRDHTHVIFDLIPMDALKALSDDTEGMMPIQIVRDSDSTLSTYGPLRTIQGDTPYAIKTTIERNVYQKALKTLRINLMAILISGLVMTLCLLVFLKITVLTPTKIISDHVQAVEHTGDLSLRLNLSRNDDIGSLAQRFDSLLKKLSSIRSYLLEQSYQSGLAGLSSDIIHHGRNTLMPLIHKTDALKNTFSSLKDTNIRQAIDEMSHQELSPERERKLNRFIALSAQEIINSIDRARPCIDDLSLLGRNMENLFGDLETYCQAQKIKSTMSPSTMIEKALTHIPSPSRENCEIIMDPNLEGLPDITLESHVLMHVLHAILMHAITFAHQRNDNHARIHIRAYVENGDEQARIRFVVDNNGPMQDINTMKDMFTRVYSEKSTVAVCSGLHWCSNIVRAMRGELCAVNENGVTAFHLILPMGDMA